MTSFSSAETADREPDARVRDRICIAALVLAALALYGNTLANAFWETDGFLLQLLAERALERSSLAHWEQVYGLSAISLRW